MNEKMHNIAVLRGIVLCMWPITGYAASQSLGATLGSVSAADWFSLLLLSGASGLVALLHRVQRQLEAAELERLGLPGNGEKQVHISWKFFALCHMTGALFMGTLCFFACEAAGDFINNYMEAAMIALISWSGAKFVDKYADRLSENALSRISGVFGSKK